VFKSPPETLHIGIRKKCKGFRTGKPRGYLVGRTPPRGRIVEGKDEKFHSNVRALEVYVRYRGYVARRGGYKRQVRRIQGDDRTGATKEDDGL
jgi:hypothetical protein